MSLRTDLVALQELDTALDQLRLRLERLPERSTANQANERLRAVHAARDAATADREAAERDLAAVEEESSEVDRHRVRLEAQMKTIISPREAEALQHEIAGLAERRSQLDDRGLAHLDAIADAEQRSADAAAAEPLAADDLAAAADALASAVAAVQSEIASVEPQRHQAADVLPEALLARYEAMRRQHGGVAVARLVGAQCTGCHIDLSIGESDEVRRVSDDQMPECPNCGRLLVP